MAYPARRFLTGHASSRPGDRLLAYGVAVLATALSVLLRLSLFKFVGDKAPFVTFFPAVILSAYLGGFRPGLLATLLGAAAANFFLLEPRYTFRIADPSDLYALGLFVLTGVALSAFGESRLRSHRRILASERRYAVTLSSIGDAVIATDTLARVTFLNPAAESLTGWPMADAIGRPLAEVFRIINEQTRQPVEDPAAKVLRLGTMVGLANHTALLARDGRETPIDDCGAPIRDDRGNIAGVVLVFRDVTQRRRAEEAEASRRTNERMELALRGSNVFVWEIEMPDGDFGRGRGNYTNLWEQLGYDAPPPGSRSGREVIHPDDLPFMDERVRAYLTGQTTEYETEIRARHADGSYRSILLRGTAVRDAAGKLARFIGIGADITELKNAREALRAREARFRALVQNSSDLISLFDAEGTVLYHSPAVEWLLGYRPPERIGRNVFRDPIVHPDDLDRKRAFFDTIRNRPGAPVTSEFRLRHADGSWREIEAVGQNFLDDPGVGGIVTNYRDVTDRKRAEKTLRESEGRFRVFVDHAADGFFLHSAEDSARILDVNRQACESLGYHRDELIGRTPLDFDPDLTPAVVEDRIRRLANGETLAFEGRRRRKDGTIFPVEIRAKAFREGSRRCLVSLMRDITERRQAEEALRHLAEQHRLALEAGNLGTWEYDPRSGRATTWDAQCQTVFGGSRENIDLEGGLAIVHPEDRDYVNQSVQEVLEPTSDGLYRNEYRVIWPDGSVHWVASNGQAYFDGEGPNRHAVRFIGTVGDITERKRAEQGLREAREELERKVAERTAELRLSNAYNRSLIEASLDPLVTIGPDGKITDVNAATEAATGRSRGELVGTDFCDYFTEPARARAGYEQVFREGKVRDYPLELRHRDGRVMSVLYNASVYRDESGQITGVFAAAHDITERRAKEAAEAANRAKDEFLANVSHEIRTPMNAILGMTDLALDTELADDQRQYLKTVRSAANSLLGIINDLLDFSKIEAGRLELDLAEFSLRATVDDTLRALATRAHYKGLELIYQVDPDVPDALVGDPVRLRQVLLNLVGNAIKFTVAGEVEVRVEVSVELVGELTSEEVGLQFAVRDTGIGIPKDQQERIFRAFEQEDTSTTRRYGGTGLGLTIASRLVALMGGMITVDSEPGRGSTFTFTARFGRQPNAPESVPVQPPVLFHDLPVLVVDDNATNRQILEGWLRSWKMEPATVGDGVAAMGALWDAATRGRPYALVLLDARMPDTDGPALAAEIRKRAELSATRIILLSSGDRPGDWERMRALQINAHLLKPVQQDELLDTIYQVMNGGTSKRRATIEDAPGSALVPRRPSLVTPLQILLAEDDEFSAQFVQQLLARAGHRVRLTMNGREGLSLAEGGGFDLLLLDIHMPELDGFGVVAAIREREQATGAHLPVIALTARSRKEDRERCLGAGMDDFLTKPVAPAALLAALDRIVSNRRPSPPPRAEAAPGGSLLDPVAVLTACGDEAEGLRGMCEDFRVYAPARLAEVVDALRDRDAQRLRLSAHKFCPLLMAFSTVAGSVASELENYAAQSQLEEVRPLVGRLETMTRELTRLVDGLSLDDLRELAGGITKPDQSADS